MQKYTKVRMEDLLEIGEKEIEGTKYEYTEYPALQSEDIHKSQISFYTIPPHKSNYPYHYHLDQEETFYIISGKGILKCVDGEIEIHSGDLIHFPSGEGGAHQLTNASDTENLIYIDFDTIAAMDVAIYPDSNKVGIWSEKVNKVYDLDSNVYYYKNEKTE